MSPGRSPMPSPLLSWNVATSRLYTMACLYQRSRTRSACRQVGASAAPECQPRQPGNHPPMPTCPHIDASPAGAAPRGATCQECEELGMTPRGLQLCLRCGHLGCSDSSQGQHARAHFELTGHPVVEGYGDGSAYKTCFVDNVSEGIEVSARNRGQGQGS
ncbi:MAG: UBP-type zinc finger domain-containing protein [Actinomycetes bacterium]